MTAIHLDESGLTVGEIVARATSWLEELTSEYADDAKLSTKEIVRSIAHFCSGLSEDAEGKLADELHLAGKLLTIGAHLIPGAD